MSKAAAFATLVIAGLSAGPAYAAVCQAGRLTCATTMPVGGYCECTSRGATEGGSVVSKAPAKTPVNSTAGGCGAQPNSPGCR